MALSAAFWKATRHWEEDFSQGHDLSPLALSWIPVFSHRCESDPITSFYAARTHTKYWACKKYFVNYIILISYSYLIRWKFRSSQLLVSQMYLFPKTVLKEEMAREAECPSPNCLGSEVCQPFRYVHHIPSSTRTPGLKFVCLSCWWISYLLSSWSTTCLRHNLEETMSTQVETFKSMCFIYTLYAHWV